MNMVWSKPFRTTSRFVRERSLLYADRPIEQRVRSNDASIQSQLMQEPWSRSNRLECTLFVAAYNGLRLLGKSEGALDAAVEPLRRRFGDRLVVDAPSVRYAFGVPTLEPYMTVAISGPHRYLAPIQTDFLRRRGRVKRVQYGGPFVLEGEAPLAGLLGYRQWLRDSLDDIPNLDLRLSRYLPIDDGGPRAA